MSSDIFNSVIDAVNSAFSIGAGSANDLFDTIITFVEALGEAVTSF